MAFRFNSIHLNYAATFQEYINERNSFLCSWNSVNSGALPSLLQVLNSEHKMNKLLDMASLENNTITNSQASEPR